MLKIIKRHSVKCRFSFDYILTNGEENEGGRLVLTYFLKLLLMSKPACNSPKSVHESI